MWTEEWTDVQSLRAHLRADNFRIVLAALESASNQPDVRFDIIGESRGMEFIALNRRQGAPDA